MLVKKNQVFLGLFLAMLFMILTGSAQERAITMYVPDTLVKIAPDRFEKIKKRMDSDILALEGRPKEQKEYISNRYKNRLEYFKISIEDGEFLIGGEIEKYLNKLMQQVLNANPSINPKIQLFVSRSTVPNAYSTGDDNIIFNIGLLNKVQNDAEIIFVLCHELAHQVLEHTKAGLYAKAEKYTNKAFVKSLNKTLKEEYNVKEKLENLIMPSLISDMRFNRQEELAADSVGFLFFSKTKFDRNAALSTIELLDSIDLFYDRDPIALSKVLNCPDYPYRAKWEPQEHHSSLMVIEDEKDVLEDSLKTHPDCKVRKEAILRQFPQSQAAIGTLFMTDSFVFRGLSMKAESENINSMFLRQNMGRMMFYAYHSMIEYPENLFARVYLAFGFSRLSHLQKTHKVGTEFPLPLNNYEVNYNKMLNFINNLNREEATNLGYCLLRPVQESLKKYEDYLAALTYSAYTSNKKEEFSSLKEEYLKKFPKGQFTDLFTELVIN